MINNSSVSVDYIYLAISGYTEVLKHICTILNENAPHKENNYTYKDINTPLSYIPDDDEHVEILKNKEKINYVISEGMEKAQLSVFSEFHDKGIYNIDWILNFKETDTTINIECPILKVSKEVDPHDLIHEWLARNKLDNYVTRLDYDLVSMTGTVSDILVISVHIIDVNSE